MKKDDINGYELGCIERQGSDHRFEASASVSVTGYLSLRSKTPSIYPPGSFSNRRSWQKESGDYEKMLLMLVPEHFTKGNAVALVMVNEGAKPVDDIIASIGMNKK